jgi:phage FluMu gp28-like protein
MEAVAEITPTPTAWRNPFPSDDPRSMLLEYQHRFFTDPARFKIGLWTRQGGKDFTTEGEAVADCFQRPKTEWMVAAPSERQALDSLDKGKEWAEAFDLAISDYQERREGSSSETLLKSAEIIFANGSRLRAVPGKPDTVRGRSANLLLTEFDFFEDSNATWRAILPSITNPLRGGQKRVRIITTPNGIGGACHKIWTKDEANSRVKWSRHKVTIEDAVRMGLPVDIEELREMFDDADGWAQEFMCEFLDTASVLLPYELIASCESFEASTAIEPDFWQTRGAFPIDLGIDFGRRRNLTVSWALEKISSALSVTKEVLELANMPTPQQVDILRPRIRKARRVCLDYTGPGIGLGDYLVQEHGEWKPEQHKFGKIELCTFSNTLKCEIFPKLRMIFERHGILVPVSVVVREDLHSMNRVVTASGNITYKAPNTPDGHADRCTAAALAVRAGSFAAAPFDFEPMGRDDYAASRTGDEAETEARFAL